MLIITIMIMTQKVTAVILAVMIILNNVTFNDRIKDKLSYNCKLCVTHSSFYKASFL